MEDSALAQGRQLHQEVSPERWCMTLKDLNEFEQAVREAWLRGEIPAAPGPEPSGHNDPSIGPTVYQVCEHFIKPVTRKAGGMSYALMLHPEGLPCDIFVTHAWAEGIFEFCHKVRSAWPRRGQHLWCCFLANPQCLDISQLLDAPPEYSPFALALEASRAVIVVPNRAVSIYSRLWCVYEAYLAVTKGKRIVLPGAVSKWQLLWGLMLDVLAPVAVGIAVRQVLFSLDVLVPPSETPPPQNGLKTDAPVLIIIGDVLALWMALRRFCAAPLLGRWLIRLLVLYIFSLQGTSFHENLAAISILAVTATVDRGYSIALAAEADQLHFSTVRHADCSSERDRERLEGCISGKEAEVDSAILALMDCGAFDAEVRQLTSDGQQLTSADVVGFWRFLVPGLALWIALLYIWFYSALDAQAVIQNACSSKGRATVNALVVASCAFGVHLLALVRGKGLASRTNASRLLLNGVLVYYATPMWTISIFCKDSDDSKDPCFHTNVEEFREGAELRTSLLAALAIVSAVLAWAGPRCTRRIFSKATRCCQMRRAKSGISGMDSSGQTLSPDATHASAASPFDINHALTTSPFNSAS